MKRFLITACLFLSPALANASADLADAWGGQASTLYSQTVAMSHMAERGEAPAMDETYTGEIAKFGQVATRLGTWIDESGKAADLGCIFRGMADEAELQLKVLDESRNAAERLAALKRLTAMFDDAQAIAAEASHAARSEVRLPDAGPACPTSKLDTQAIDLSDF